MKRILHLTPALLPVLLSALLLSACGVSGDEAPKATAAPTAAVTPKATEAPPVTAEPEDTPTPAVTAEPAPEATPAGILGWLTVPREGVWLTEQEVAEWNSWFYGAAEDPLRWEKLEAGDYIRSQFLTHTYECPEELDLKELFYNGSGQPRAEITTADISAQLRQLGYWYAYTDADKLPLEDLEASLLQYTGLQLRSALEDGSLTLPWAYVPETDSCYHFHGDTNATRPDMEFGYRLGDTLHLFYLHSGSDRELGYCQGYFRVTLQQVGEAWQFRSNLFCDLSGEGVVYRRLQAEEFPRVAIRRDWVLLENLQDTALSGSDMAETRDLLRSRPGFTELALEENLQNACSPYGSLLYGLLEGEAQLYFLCTDGRCLQLPLPGGGSLSTPEAEGSVYPDCAGQLLYLQSWSPEGGDWELTLLMSTGEAVLSRTPPADEAAD